MHKVIPQKMKDKYLDALNSLLNKDINSAEDLEVWKGQAINTVSRIFGEKCSQIEQIKLIVYRTFPRMMTTASRGAYGMGGGNNLEKCKTKAYGLAQSFIDELELLGLPEIPSSDSPDKINITISQNQNVQIDLDLLLGPLRDELTGKQLKEVQEIISSSDPKDQKKKKISDLLISFGSDVVSNILANILANPQIFG